MKRKLWFKIVAILMAVLLLGTLMLTIFAALFSAGAVSAEMEALEEQQEENKRQQEALQEQQNELANQKYTLQSSISEISRTIDTIQQEKEEYDRLIVVSQQEIALLDEQIALLETEIEYKRQEYENALAAEDEQWELFRTQFRAMEERGTVSYLEFLFDHYTSFSDLLSRLDMMDEILAQGENAIDAMEQARREVLLAQQELFDSKQECELKQVEEAEAQEEFTRLIEEACERIKELEDEKTAQEADAAELQEQILAIEAALKAEQAEAAAIDAQIEELERLEELKNAGVSATGTYLWPSASSTYVTSQFGMRLHPILGYYTMHNGIDIGASYGTAIYASDGGIVVTATYSYSYGNYVMICHGTGRYTLYAHMSSMAVSEGDAVSQGSVIGYVGTTGYATGPHIHFEIIENDTRVNPLQFFSNYTIWD